MARYLVKYKIGSSFGERHLDLNFGGEGEAKEQLCRQSSSFRDAIILGVSRA